MTPDERLITAVRDGLAGVADPEKAPGMREYMKSEMPFRGVRKPERQKLGRGLFADHPMSDVDTWVATVLALWRGAEYREERYLAIDLTGERRYAGWQDSALLPVYEELIVTGAWCRHTARSRGSGCPPQHCSPGRLSLCSA